MTPSDDVVCIGGIELEKSLDWGPELAGSKRPLGRLGGNLTCLVPCAGVGGPVGEGGAGGPGGRDLLRGVGDGGGDCDVPPGAGMGPGLLEAAVARL